MKYNDIDSFYYNFNVKNLCGVDEAGRGPLAGDVFAAAVILEEGCTIPGINDSKKLSLKKREALYDIIIENSKSYSIANASVFEIDSLNILQATFLAMQRAVSGLNITPDLVIVDGNNNPTLEVHSKCIIKGDSKYAAISAASILAKVARDRYMLKMDKKYPIYNFSKHKGYGTKLHYELINEYGPCDLHRRSFLKKLLNKEHTYNIGLQGENYSKSYLINNGYKVLCSNYRTENGEIDIIAKKSDYIYFIEVKTRTKGCKYSPAEDVDYSKKVRIIRTAYNYLSSNFVKLQPVFDIIEIVSSKNDKLQVCEFWHIQNAFDIEGVML